MYLKRIKLIIRQTIHSHYWKVKIYINETRITQNAVFWIWITVRIQPPIRLNQWYTNMSNMHALIFVLFIRISKNKYKNSIWSCIEKRVSVYVMLFQCNFLIHIFKIFFTFRTNIFTTMFKINYKSNN